VPDSIGGTALFTNYAGGMFSAPSIDADSRRAYGKSASADRMQTRGTPNAEPNHRRDGKQEREMSQMGLEQMTDEELEALHEELERVRTRAAANVDGQETARNR